MQCFRKVSIILQYKISVLIENFLYYLFYVTKNVVISKDCRNYLKSVI